MKEGCIYEPWLRYYAEPAVAGSTMISPEDPEIHVYDLYDQADMVVFTIDNPPGEHQRSYTSYLGPDRDCVLLSKGRESVAVFFTIVGPFIKSIYYRSPPFNTYRQSGIYPE